MKRHYIVCMRDDNLRLIGPFESRDTLCAWASSNNPTDDPRWQSVELDGDESFGWRHDDPAEFTLAVYRPTDCPMPD